MIAPAAYAFDRQRIVVADDDSVTSARIISVLRRDGHCVVLEPGALSADGFLSLTRCHLLISSLLVEGVLRPDLLRDLRQQLPSLPVLYLADASQSALDATAELPADLPTLRVAHTAGELMAAVRGLLPQLRAGTILARVVEQPPSPLVVPAAALHAS